MINKYIVFLLICFCAPAAVFSASFNVDDPAELQSALNTASFNGEDDTIILASGLYNITSTITFWSEEENSLQITSENAPVFNGGDLVRIFDLMTVSNNGDLIIENLTIEHGLADFGGAMYIETGSADINVSNCTIADNQANNVGGGVNLYSNTGNIEVVNCEFIRNSSPNSTGYPFGTAGGLFIQTEGSGPEIRLIDCIFEDNTAERDAAGAMLYPMGNNSSVIAENNTFNNNTANEFGGGCWIRCPGENSTITFNNNLITDNSTAFAGSGGGTYIEIESGDIDVLNNTFENNNSIWRGGALWISNIGGTLDIRNNIFTNNTSIQTGGAANTYLEAGSALIEHNVFNENESSDSGGGLCFATASAGVSVFNNTFWNNSALDGGDVYFYFDSASSSSSFYNNILYGSSTPALSFSGASSVIAVYSDIESGIGQPWFGTGCIDLDPQFVDSTNSDFNLTSTSPCIDAGDPTSANDPDGTINDMGAFYYNQSFLLNPENLVITYTSGNIVLNWDSVGEATSYTVYSDYNPTGSFDTNEWTGTLTEWSESITDERKFYRVTASN